MTTHNALAVAALALLFISAPAIRAQAPTSVRGGRAGAPGAPGPAERQAGGVAKPRPAPRQSMHPPIMDNQIFTHVLFNQLEARSGSSGSEFHWDGEAWVGTDLNRLWFKSEGSAATGGTDAEIEALYDRPLPRWPYFDGQIGIREDLGAGPHRTWLAVGMEGLAPGFFDVEPTLYIGKGGAIAARFTGSYDLLLTQRLVAQPELELNAYGTPDPARRLGTGITDLDTGLRLRYEIRRKFAPYLGFDYARKYGGTAAFARAAGERVAGFTVLLGLRVWY